MKFESAKTEKGNIGVSVESQEKANEQAAQMDAGGNVNCCNCNYCSDCRSCSGLNEMQGKSKETATLIANAEILAEFKKWKRVAMPSCDENGFYPEWLYGEASGFHAGYLAGQRGFDEQAKSFDQLMNLTQELVDSLRLTTVLLMGSSRDAEGMELGRVRARIDAVNLLILKADNLLFGGEKVANDLPETPINKEV